ncbi:hypothetical protein [Pseudonocardia kunmingensis]|uniref:DUF2127 domain-containing protein n=1 Tax=Pseudonocardia kunmingensis TaxID=630975 RepID=A0A543DYB5_9PSEU|nr:hypothetical protein [Pseudonocardia kunmingensis]TQM14323.1 hypothetical protein FB558_1085 [Pseudonocardia kunmingensis]
MGRSRRLQVLTAVCSAVFAIGTALQAFVVIDEELVARAMELAGAPATEAPGFVAVLRAVGVAYVVGNALGLLALTGRAWVFWVVLVVNVTQAAGVVAGMVPAVVLQAARDEHGVAGLLPTFVTDGGAAVLVLVLLWFSARYRGPWARGDQRRRLVAAR